MSDAVVQGPPPTVGPDARATVVVGNLHVTYRVLVGAGQRVSGARRLLKRGLGVREFREVNAVRGVSFTAREGEAIGLIGRNGSGKSTLLRAVAGLVPPSRGAVWADGEPALLGVNAALVNELSGERNVLLGTLALGLTPAEARAVKQEIVDFADIGEFIDLPMRTYSSGMGARLRFAIATATPQRVLLIDEALATGDAEFRRRSEERVNRMREQAGTVFLVSHSLSVIEHTCNRALWLDRGLVLADGPVDEVVAKYREATSR